MRIVSTASVQLHRFQVVFAFVPSSSSYIPHLIAKLHSSLLLTDKSCKA